VDLNADLGESFGVWRLGDDEAMLAIITSANVACGYHAGDAATMHRICDQAAQLGVCVGAQVGYRDVPGFGRRRIDYDTAVLRDEIIYQIGALAAFCHCAGITLAYVKPHGALYHAAATDPAQAMAVVDAVRLYDPSLPILGPPRGALTDTATAAGLTMIPEGFADRSYTADGGLLPRGVPGAIITDPTTAATQALRLATQSSVVAVDGTVVGCPVESICLHGDTPGAVVLARAVRDALDGAGVPIAPFNDLCAEER
jgi:UPF0271 protein